jgi:hypothetical protein
MQISLHAMIVFVGRRYIFVLRSKGKNIEPGSRKIYVSKFMCDVKLSLKDAQ